MARAGCGMFICSNILTFISSLPVLASALILRYYGNTRCSGFVEMSMWVLGVFLLLVSLAGMAGSWCGVTFILWLYQWLLFFLILALCCFVAFMLVTMGESRRDGGRWSHWLHGRLVDERNWIGVRSCLAESKICSTLAVSRGQYAVLCPIEHGCCVPPSECGFVKNGSSWTIPTKSGPGVSNKLDDCVRWSSRPERLCYDCNSCKDGFVERLRNELGKLTTLSICLLVFLIINFVIGFVAFTSTHAVDLFQTARA